MAIPTRQAGWPWWSLVLAFLVLAGLATGLILIGRSWDPFHALLSWLGRPRREHVAEVMTPTTFAPSNNGLPNVTLPTASDAWKAEQARMAQLLEDQRKATAKLQAELDAVKKRKGDDKGDGKESKETKEKKPVEVKRAPGIKIHHELPPVTNGRPVYVLAPGATKIPIQVEMAMNSDVGNSYFTATVTRPVFDTRTRRVELISQGDTVLAKDEGANITVGNELLPALGVTLTRRDGSSVDLGAVPVTDAKGINGLASRVNHHYVRNVLAGFMLGTLKVSRQVVQQEVAKEAGIFVGTPGQVVERQVGRAIDMRPTIEVDAGELGNVVLLKPLSLEEVQ